MYKKVNKHDVNAMCYPEPEKWIKSDNTDVSDSSNANTNLYRFTNYIEKVVIHAKIDYLRHQQQIEDHEDLTDEMQEIVGRQYSHSLNDDFLLEAIKVFTLEQIATNENLYDAIRILSSAEKEVLYHIFVEERTPKETALLMKNSWSWILRIKKRALKKLYEVLNEEKF